MDNKNHTVMHLVGLSSIALGLAFMISPNNHSALAQQLNGSNSGGNSSSGTNKTISITMTPNTQQQQNTFILKMDFWCITCLFWIQTTPFIEY
jgi:hypothetical protein